MTHALSYGSDDTEERRLVQRRRAYKGIVISFNGGTSTFEGVARNLSETGARLSFCETFAIPLEFLSDSVATWRGDQRSCGGGR